MEDLSVTPLPRYPVTPPGPADPSLAPGRSDCCCGRRSNEQPQYQHQPVWKRSIQHRHTLHTTEIEQARICMRF